MFVKGKWKVWIVIILFSVMTSGLMKGIHKIIEGKKEKETINYTISMKTENQLLNSRVANKKIVIENQPYLFINTETNPDIIISEHSSDLEYPGYDKLNGYLYTSFTMFSSADLYNYKETWINSVKEHTYDKYSKDIRILLEAIENGRSWKDIGIYESNIIKNLNERVKLYIPNRYHYSYRYLRLYIAMALNDYKPIDSSNQEDLLKRADGIISKSDECEVLEVMKNRNLDGIILAPESTIAECSQKFTDSSLGIISPGKSLRIEYDVYVKPDKTEQFKGLSKEYKFLNLFGLRSINGNDLSSSQNLFRRCFDVTDTIKLDDIAGSTEILKSVVFMPEDIKPVETETQTESVNESSVSEDIRTNETSTDEVEENENSEEQQESEKGASRTFDPVDIFFLVWVIFLVIMFVCCLFALIIC